MNGYLGLTKSINDRESANRELAVLERMEARQETEKNQEVQAQIMQDQMYQKMYQQADQLLGKDRNRINKQIKAAQRQVQNGLDKYGGSKRDFIANGGMSLLGNIETDILQSEEAIRYRENKQNFARIMEAQEKGLGHLIIPNDLKSVEDYHNNEDGATITYTGMMAEVEIPHQQFALGQEINPWYIMNHSSNMVKILGNYAKVHPDRPEPEMDENGRLTETGQAEVFAFMKRMGYGGLGENATMLKLGMQKQKAAAEAKAKEQQRTALGAINEIHNMMPPGLTIDQVSPEYMDKMLQENGSEAMRSLFGDNFSERSRRRNIAISDSDLFGEFVDYFSQDKVGLRGSKQLALVGSDRNKIIEETLGVKIEGNKINGMSVSGEMYAADGTKVKNASRFNAEDYGKNFEVMGLVTGFKSSVANGKDGNNEDILLINAYDDDGTFDKKSTNKFYENKYGDQMGSETRLGYFIALKGEDGDLVYEEVDIHKPTIRTALGNAMGDNNNITETVEENNLNAQARQEFEQMNAAQKIQYEDYKDRSLEVLDDPVLREEASQYVAPGSGGSVNRNKMMQSFYMAFETTGREIQGLSEDDSGNRLKKSMDSGMFSAYMDNAEVTPLLKDFDKRPEEIIKTFMDNTIKIYEPGSVDYEANKRLALKWQQILNTL